MELLMASTTAKLVASSITYPHEVLRARLQDGRRRPPNISNNASIGDSKGIKYNNGGLFSLLRQIIREEGVLALWSGLRMNIFRIVPATAATFLSYEYISRYLQQSNLL